MHRETKYNEIDLPLYIQNVCAVHKSTNNCDRLKDILKAV